MDRDYYELGVAAYPSRRMYPDIPGVQEDSFLQGYYDEMDRLSGVNTSCFDADPDGRYGWLHDY